MCRSPCSAGEGHAHLKKQIHSKERKGQVMFREVIDLKKRKIHRLKKKKKIHRFKKKKGGGSSLVADCPVSLKEKYL